MRAESRIGACGPPWIDKGAEAILCEIAGGDRRFEFASTGPSAPSDDLLLRVGLTKDSVRTSRRLI